MVGSFLSFLLTPLSRSKSRDLLLSFELRSTTLPLHQSFLNLLSEDWDRASRGAPHSAGGAYFNPKISLRTIFCYIQRLVKIKQKLALCAPVGLSRFAANRSAGLLYAPEGRVPCLLEPTGFTQSRSKGAEAHARVMEFAKRRWTASKTKEGRWEAFQASFFTPCLERSRETYYGHSNFKISLKTIIWNIRRLVKIKQKPALCAPVGLSRFAANRSAGLLYAPEGRVPCLLEPTGLSLGFSRLRSR